MSKMQEAFDEFMAHDDWRFADREAAWKWMFEAGYQAAIAAVKAGGPSGFLYLWDKGGDVWRYKPEGEALFDFIPNPHTCAPLYKLPEGES